MITNYHNPLLPRCVDCPTPPVCGCGSDQDCLLIGKSCDQCPYYQCVAKPEVKSNKSVSAGAVAGAVIGSVILLALVISLFIWNRKRTRAAAAAAGEKSSGSKEVPANALDVLNRPDPNEKAQQQAQAFEAEHTYALYPATQTTINLDPEAQRAVAVPVAAPVVESSRPAPFRRESAQSNPFTDTHSIQTTTTGSQSINVIPIALAPRTPPSDGSFMPPRPSHTPDLELNMDHLAVSEGSASPYPPSERSGASGAAPVAPTRYSYMSGMTTATDILNEAPRIVTPVRQVINMGKAEVLVRSPVSSAPSTPSSAENLRPLPPTSANSRSGRSPLAANTFGPSDVLHEDDAGEAAARLPPHQRGDPFGDENRYEGSSDDNHAPRPMSSLTMATNAGTIIADIGQAMRVQVGVPVVPASAAVKSNPPVALHRVASGRLITPRSTKTSNASSTTTPVASKPTSTNASPLDGTLQEQQARALAYAQLKAHEMTSAGHPGANRRVSDASVSTRADSILESFPFVPPSPISDRPARSPRSPLAQEATNASFASAAAHVQHYDDTAMDDMPAPPSRATLGMSTGSQLSTASSGLGAFAFTIEHAAPQHGLTPVAPSSALPPLSAVTPAGAPPSAFARQQQTLPTRQRASLDTLALTADLSSYPLGFEQPPMPPVSRP